MHDSKQRLANAVGYASKFIEKRNRLIRALLKGDDKDIERAVLGDDSELRDFLRRVRAASRTGDMNGKR